MMMCRRRPLCVHKGPGGQSFRVESPRLWKTLNGASAGAVAPPGRCTTSGDAVTPAVPVTTGGLAEVELSDKTNVPQSLRVNQGCWLCHSGPHTAGLQSTLCTYTYTYTHIYAYTVATATPTYIHGCTSTYRWQCTPWHTCTYMWHTCTYTAPQATGGTPRRRRR